MNPLIEGNTLIILRAASGAGKTTFAEFLESMADPGHVKIFTADDYFIDADGNYNFDLSKLDAAHAQCRKNAMDEMNRCTRVVIVANTSTSRKEYKDYEDYARFKGYEIVSLVLENLHGNSDVHGVPVETLKRQKEKLKESLRL